MNDCANLSTARTKLAQLEQSARFWPFQCTISTALLVCYLWAVHDWANLSTVHAQNKHSLSSQHSFWPVQCTISTALLACYIWALYDCANLSTMHVQNLHSLSSQHSFWPVQCKMAFWWCNSGICAVLLRSWILSDLRVFCADFVGPKVRWC